MASPALQLTAAPLSQGSIWRKWDLHIHSPLSHLSNQFARLPSGAPDWEAYLCTLEALSDVAVIGVTDYFSVDGYKQVLGYKRDGRLPNIARILPNIELRLDTFVVDDKARDVNFHVIFSDELHPEDIEKEFLETLRVRVSGSVSGVSGVRQLTERTLIQLGQEIKKHHALFQHDSDLVAALKNINVSLDQVQELLRKDIFQNKFLLVLAGSEWGDIDWNQAYLTKKTFYRPLTFSILAHPRRLHGRLGSATFRPTNL